MIPRGVLPDRIHQAYELHNQHVLPEICNDKTNDTDK